MHSCAWTLRGDSSGGRDRQAKPSAQDGGEPVGELPTAVPRTLSAVGHLCRSACPPDARRQAGELLLALAAVECHVSVGGPDQVPPALLRDLVVIVGKMAGPTWLETRADGAAGAIALQASWQPPPLPELDQLLAGALFGPVRPSGGLIAR